MITAVKLTAPRFTGARATIPTIEVYEAPEMRPGHGAHRRVMAAAHLLAAAIEHANGVGWPVSVEAIGTAHARLTVETIEDSDAERDTVLGILRDACAGKLTPPNILFREGRAEVVSIPTD